VHGFEALWQQKQQSCSWNSYLKINSERFKGFYR